MQKYSLELENWGNWQLEKDFASLDRAKRYGLDRFPQNEWRVIDRHTGGVVYQHDPTAAMQQDAELESRRFQQTERWRQIFADRAAADVVERQNRERLLEVAARQRSRQRSMDEERRRRLRGFNFVGSRPRVLEQWDIEEFLESVQARRRDELEDKVNWRLEGF